MRFLVDECTGPAVAHWLKEQGHDVFSVYERARGASDSEILRLAVAEDRVVITTDKDFGEMVYRGRRLHTGIVLLRLQDASPAKKIGVLRILLAGHAERLRASFVVVTEEQVRFARS